MGKPKYSIVIPTYNHLDDFLKPCLQSIIQFTDLDKTEVIVVANGCVDATHQYVEALSHVYPSFRLIREKNGIGYTKATNLGIKAAQGEYVVLLNNDTKLLDQPKNRWLELLEEPFTRDSKASVSGPLELYDKITQHHFIVFFCAMVPRHLFDELGLLDEIFSPGSAEDIDFCVRAALKGYRHHPVPGGPVTLSSPKTFTGTFPIYHYAEGTFEHIEEYGNVTFKRNSLVNLKRYNKDIKLHLTLEHDNSLPAHVRVGNSKYSELLLEWNHLDFENNTVSEIALINSIERVTSTDLPEYIKEWHRVLKPGGKLVIVLVQAMTSNIKAALTEGGFTVHGIQNFDQHKAFLHASK